MAESGYLGHVVRKLTQEAIGGARIVPSNARANGSQISLGGGRYDQPFGGDGASPNRTMSARSSSALVYSV
jgi:hypothetical protein